MSPLIVTYASVVARGSSAKTLTVSDHIHVSTSQQDSTRKSISSVGEAGGHDSSPHGCSVDQRCSKFLAELERCLLLESKYVADFHHGSPHLSPGNPASNIVHPQVDDGSISSGMRDGSAHVLRCLKVWYDLPSDVFFGAISSIDRFLSKMKAQPKHLSCIAVSAFHLSCVQHQSMQRMQRDCRHSCIILVPEPTDLVNISQSRCSPSDLLRMQVILGSKLELNPGAGPEAPITSLTFLRLMFATARAAAARLGLEGMLSTAEQEDHVPEYLLSQLEILACDSATLRFRPAHIALALLASDFQRRAALQPDNAHALLGLISEIQKYCNLLIPNFLECLAVVVDLLKKYNGECTVTHRQRLIWKLSNRTMRHLRPTEKLGPTLPTIREISRHTLGPSDATQRSRNPSGSSLQSIDGGVGGCDSDMSYDDDEEALQWSTEDKGDIFNK